MSRGCHRRFIGLAITAISVPLPSLAQTIPAEQADHTTARGAADQGKPHAEPDTASTSGDIVVTAQRREQRLQDVPVSVSVVTGAALERGNLRTLQDIAERLPDVKITTGQTANSLNIRGIGSGVNPGFEQSVATFVDDLYRPRSYAIRAALFDVAQVEVLKGPQTTFFGANAIAGALNITTRKATSTPAWNATALYGSDNEFSLEGGVTQPLTDTLSTRVAGRFYGMDDFVHNSLRDHQGHVRELTGRVQFHWAPTAGVRSDLRIEGDRLRDGTAYDNELLNCPADPAYPAFANVACVDATSQSGGSTVDDRLNRRSNIIPGYAHNDYHEIGWTNSLDVHSLTLTAVTGFYKNKYSFLQDLLPIAPTGPGTEGSFLVTGGERYRQFSQELRVQSPSNRPIEFLAGLYYQRSRLSSDNYGSLGLFSPYVPPFSAFVPFGALFAGLAGPGQNPLGYNAATKLGGYTLLSQHENTKSAFAAVTVRPFTGLRINGGLRYSSVTKTAHRYSPFGTFQGDYASPDDFMVAPDVSQPVLATLFSGDLGDFQHPHRRDNKLMPSAGLQYDAGRNLMLYATYAKGFKAGGFGGLNKTEEFGPENVDAYEVGAKGSLPGHMGSFTLAIFRSDYKDLQESTTLFLPSGAVTNVTTNAAAARSQGVEAGLVIKARSDLSLSVDAAYLDSRFRDFPNGACTVLQATMTQNCVQDLSGTRRPFAPKVSGNVALSYRPEIGSWRLEFEPVAYFTGSYFQQASGDDLLRQKGYAKVDLRIGAGPSSGKWDIAIVAKNLTDKQTAGYRNAVPSSAGSVLAFPERGRSASVSLTMHD